MSWRIPTAVSKEQCITTALSASRWETPIWTEHHWTFLFLDLEKDFPPCFYSICSTPQRISVCCNVGTQFIWSAWTRWERTISKCTVLFRVQKQCHLTWQVIASSFSHDDLSLVWSFAASRARYARGLPATCPPRGGSSMRRLRRRQCLTSTRRRW